MKPGEITQPIRTTRGVQILKLETIKPAGGPAVRERSRSGRRQSARRAAADRSAQVPVAAARPGAHRMEERGAEEAVREAGRRRARRRRSLTNDRGAVAPRGTPIWTRSRHESVVREQLETKGYEAFLPTIPRWSRWKDRKKKIDWPLFPGYCFARFDARERCRS